MNTSRRITFFQILLLVYFVFILAHIFNLQVLHRDMYAQSVHNQSSERVVVSPRRGMIFDRKNRVLAKSLDRNSPIRIVEDSIDQDEIYVNRLYQFGHSGSPVIGWAGSDKGWGGVEYSFNEYLTGEVGYNWFLYDGRRRQYSSLDQRGLDPVDGYNVHLTLDMEVQKIVEDVLHETAQEYEARNAFAVIMDPYSGDILAMASNNGFNPNYWWKFQGTDRNNLPISFNYEPGSTFKTLTLAAALEEGLFAPDDILDVSSGVFEIDGEMIRDSRHFDTLTVEQALWFSSNVAFARIGDSLGVERTFNYLSDYGFGQGTGIRLPGEQRGVVRDKRRWSRRTPATVAFGHEFSSTLLQLVQATNVVANGGYLVRPRIFREITDSRGTVVTENDSTILHRVLSANTALEMRRILRGVVDSGTARNISYDIGSLGGKTGTSEKVDPETGEYSTDKVVASFVGMSPVEKPGLIGGVVVDEPRDAESGGAVAAPALAEIFTRIAQAPTLSYGLVPDKEPIIDYSMSDEENNSRVYPDMNNHSRLTAVETCRELDIPFEFVGNGEFVINQTPHAGARIIGDTPILLFTNSDMDMEDKSIMPNCVGRSMKDAINTLSIDGITPYFKGTGNVRAQSPTAGAIVEERAVCTLYGESL
ncbi:MAG: penicillin-binding transpeptidase domain-containing protein [Fibrobacterota bacterium]